MELEIFLLVKLWTIEKLQILEFVEQLGYFPLKENEAVTCKIGPVDIGKDICCRLNMQGEARCLKRICVK